MATDEYSPEKAGVGGSTPSRGTVTSTTYKPQNLKTCSNLFQNQNPGPAEVCLSRRSVESAVCSFAKFLNFRFAEDITKDPKGVQEVRSVRRELPPRRGRPHDPHIDAATLMIEDEGKTLKEVMRLCAIETDRQLYAREIIMLGVLRRRGYCVGGGLPPREKTAVMEDVSTQDLKIR
jgi:hypothetical protein